jgi:SAM-dependent methyltransferase
VKVAAFVPDAERSNHTIDYFRELLPRIPSQARTALDIGCGEGFAARALASRGLEVTAVDLNEPSLAAAREQDTTGIDYRLADFLTDDALTRAAGSFDVVTALAVLHHVDLDAGLLRCRELLGPGGTLLVVGCAASELRRDSWREVAAVAADKWARLRGRPRWDHPSPTVWPPPVTYSEVRDAAARIMPGANFERRLLWRYTIEWTKPTARSG